MLKTWRNATAKQQCGAAICFIIAYFSPLVGVVMYLFMRFRHTDSLFRIAIIIGAIAALLLYSLDSIIYLM